MSPHARRNAVRPIAEARRRWNSHWGRAATLSVGAVTSTMRVEQILTARFNALLKPWELTFLATRP
jgi:hypothetical protein